MHGIGGEHDAFQSQVVDHLLCSRDFVGLLVNVGVREHDRRWRGKGGQGLRCLLVTQMIETAPNRRTRDAYRTAHAERGAAFAAIMRRVFARS